RGGAIAGVASAARVVVSAVPASAGLAVESLPARGTLLAEVGSLPANLGGGAASAGCAVHGLSSSVGTPVVVNGPGRGGHGASPATGTATAPGVEYGGASGAVSVTRPPGRQLKLTHTDQGQGATASTAFGEEYTQGVGATAAGT
ncbi:unnamed protein product, partial [Amoebophrya sp. A120]